MGDHLVLLVNRLLTESTLQAAIESRNQSMLPTPSETDDAEANYSIHKVDIRNDSSPRKLVECRICQDEDEDSNMETPCSCCGSMKYAHRRCIQRWCNEKGDTVCEICHREFTPGYTAPPPLFPFGQIPMNFRGNWQISRRDLNNSHFIAMVSTDTDYVDPRYDENAAANSRSLICCRSVAIIFMVLLILRHTLPVIISGRIDHSLPLLMLLLVRSAGIILPIYVMIKAVTAVQRRRQQQESFDSFSSSDEETEQSDLQSQTLVHVP